MAEEIKFKLGLDLKSAQKSMGALIASAQKIGKAMAKAGGTISRGFSKALGGAAKGLKSIAKIAGGGLGLGLIASGFSKMTDSMGASYKVQKLLNTTMNLFIGLANGVVEVLEPMFDWFFKAFTKPKEWWDELVGAFKTGAAWIKDNLVDYVLAGMANMLDKLTVGFLEVRKGWNEMTGDMEEADEIGKKIEQINKDIDERNKQQEKRASNVKQVMQNVVDWTNKAIKTVGDATTKVMSNNDALIAFERTMGLLEIAYQGIIEKYDKLTEQQRQIRDDETKSIDERMEANRKLGELLKEQSEEEKKNINARIAEREKNMAILGYSWDREKEILDLKKELTAVDAKITGFQSEQLQNENALKKERYEMAKSQKETAVEMLDLEMQTALAKEENIKKQFEIQKEYAQKIYEAQQAIYDADLANSKEGTEAYTTALNEKLKSEKEYQLKVAEINKEATDYQKELDKSEEDGEKAKMQAKVDTLNTAMGQMKQLVGEDTKLGMALSIAQAIADTYTGATKAFAQGGVFGYIGAAGVIAAGMANVKKIMEEARKVDSLVGGASSGGASSISVGPSIGLVGGQVNNQSQILASMDGSLNKPSRSYVVSTDVSSQQSLDRKVRQNATLGG